MEDVIEKRLIRAGLDPEQVATVISDNRGNLEGLQRWLETVHDNDIQEKFGGTDAQAAPAGEAEGRAPGSE